MCLPSKEKSKTCTDQTLPALNRLLTTTSTSAVQFCKYSGAGIQDPLLTPDYQYLVVFGRIHNGLAWAMTINNVQGLSPDRAVMDLSSPVLQDVFAYRMANVALNRIESSEGICVIGHSHFRREFYANDWQIPLYV